MNRYILLIIASLLSSNVAFTQDYSWSNYSGGNWSSALNWSPNSGLTPGIDSILTFGSSQSSQTSNSIASIFDNPYDVNSLRFENVAGTTYSVSGLNASSTIRFNRSSSSVQPSLIVSGMGSVNFSNQSATAGMTLVGAGTRLQIGGQSLGRLSIASTIVESGGSAGIDINRGIAGLYGRETGLIILSGNNTFTGGVRLIAGNLAVSSANALGTGTLTIDGADSSIRFDNAPTINNPILLNQTMRILGGEDLAYTGATLAGSISGSGGLTFAPGGNLFQMKLTAANSFQGALTMAPTGAGSVNLTVEGNGTVANASAYSIQPGSVFNLGGGTGPTTGRVNLNAVLSMNSSALYYSPSNSTASSETFRRLEISGNNTLHINAVGNNETKLTFTEGLVRQNNATINFTASYIGNTSPQTATNYYFPVALTGAIGGGGAAGTTTRSILPYATANSLDGSTFIFGGVVAWDSTLNRIEPLKTTEMATNLVTTGILNPNANVRVFQSPTNPQGGSVSNLYNPTTINSLFLSNYSTTISPSSPFPWRETFVGSSVQGTNTLTVQSGMIQVGSGGSSNNIGSIINVGTLNFGGVTGYLHGVGMMNSQITGSSGLVVAGTWTLGSLNNSFTGDLTLNGTARFANAANLGPVSNLISMNGGTLSLMPDALNGIGMDQNVTLNHAITLNGKGNFTTEGTSGSFVSSGNARLTLAGPINGTGSLNYSGSSVLTISNLTNSYTGGTASLGGLLRVAGDGSLGASSGAIGLYGSAFEAMNSFTTARDFNLVDRGSGRSNTFLLGAGVNLTVDGRIFGSTIGANSSPLVKSGPGTLTLTALNPFIGPVILGDGRDGFNRWITRVWPSTGTGAQSAGTLQLSGANGALPMATEFSIDSKAVLHLDNSVVVNNTRIGVVPIRLNGGELRITGNSSADVNQWIGTVQAGDGTSSPLAGTITLDQSTGTNRLTSATALSLTPLSQSMFFVRGTNLGGSTGNRTQLLVANAPTLVNGLIPSAVGAKTATGSATDFLTHIPNGSQFSVVPFTSYAGDLPVNTGNAASTYDQTTSKTLAGNVAANALRVSANSTIDLNGQTLTLGSATQAGTMLVQPGITSQITNGTIAFGTSPGRITNDNTVTLGTNAAPITLTGSRGLIKNGPGTLVISGTNTITDSAGAFNLVVGQGTVQLATTSSIVSGSNVMIGAGATLDLPVEQTFTDIRGYGTIQIGTRMNLLNTSFDSLQFYAGSLSGSGTLRFPAGNFQIYTFNGSSPGFTGAVELLGGEVAFNAPNAIGVATSPLLLGNLTGSNFAAMSFGSAVESVTRDITVQGPATGSGSRTITFGAQYATYSGQLTLNAPNTRINNGAGGVGTVLNLNGSITGTGALTIGSNNSHININGNNTYSGGTSISLERNMVLGIGSNSPFGTGPVSIGANGTGYNGYFRADQQARTISNAFSVPGLNSFGVTGSNDVIFSGAFSPPVSNSFGFSFVVLETGRMVLSNAISSAGTTVLHKMGPGILALEATSGSPSLTSSFNVYAGTLAANNTSGSATGSGTVRIFKDATLMGSGRITGATTVDAGGIVRGGSTETGTGTLTFTSPLTLASNARIGMNVSGSAASRILVPSLTASGTVELNLRDVGGLTNGQTYVYEVVRTTSSNSFNLSNFILTANFDTTSLFLSQPGGANNVLFVNFAPVPEPGSILAVSVLASIGVMYRRRRLARSKQLV